MYPSALATWPRGPIVARTGAELRVGYIQTTHWALNPIERKQTAWLIRATVFAFRLR